MTFCSGLIYAQDKTVENDLLWKFVKSNLRFPIKSQIEKHEGTLVGGIIFKEGKSKFILLNSSEKSLNLEFKRVMARMMKKFQISGVDTLLFHVEYKHTDHNYLVDLTNKPDMIQKPIIMKSRGKIGNSSKKRVSSNPVDYEKSKLVKLRKYVDKEKYKKAVSLVNSMIRRNPYVPEFYHLRALCYSNLGRQAEGGKRFNRMITLLKYKGYKEDFVN
ncbi:tetratricopeptide repeat protein [Ancylomarina sp. YFZ004]